jgi:hypothetical protein
MIKKYFVIVYVLIILLPALSWGADKIQGSACYTYGDNESLVQAEQMTKTLAIRNAIESYSTFIESTTQVTDFQLSNDLINTVSSGKVKRINVLKRLQSGRMLCYTIEGYVEPNDLKIAIREYLSGKRKIATGRVKENEWIKIVDNFVQELTPEEFFQTKLSDHQLQFYKGKIYKRLWVEIEFLKPCTASTLFKEISGQYGKEWDEFVGNASKYPKPQFKLSPKSMAFMMLQFWNKEFNETGKSNQGLWKEYEAHCAEHGLDPIDFMSNLYVPKFRCDDKLKVFVTFLSTGGELETVGIIPVAQLINDKSNDRKKLMVSGERTSAIFSIPDKANSWEVWVPK